VKKEVGWPVVIAVVVIVLAVVAYFYYSRTATPPPQEASVFGADAPGGGAGPGMTPDVMTQAPQQAPTGPR
jgi:heme/copper-type cytochrome/quinol oxidase subunit 2